MVISNTVIPSISDNNFLLLAIITNKQYDHYDINH